MVTNPRKPISSMDMIDMTISTNDIPDHIRWLHKCASEGSGNKYAGASVGFIIHDTDGMCQPALLALTSVILHYKKKDTVIL